MWGPHTSPSWSADSSKDPGCKPKFQPHLKAAQARLLTSGSIKGLPRNARQEWGWGGGGQKDGWVVFSEDPAGRPDWRQLVRGPSEPALTRPSSPSPAPSQTPDPTRLYKLPKWGQLCAAPLTRSSLRSSQGLAAPVPASGNTLQWHHATGLGSPSKD